MIEIDFRQMLLFVTAAWILVRIACFRKNGETTFFKEVKLLPAFFWILIVFRIVYFPWRPVDGGIGPLVIDLSRIRSAWINLRPMIVLDYAYNGWEYDVYGNMIMFLPVGFIWPLCFKKLDTVWKTVLAGAAFSLFIEVSQLLIYERCSDIDDFLYNTVGAFLGALVCFGGKWVISRIADRSRYGGGLRPKKSGPVDALFPGALREAGKLEFGTGRPIGKQERQLTDQL